MKIVFIARTHRLLLIYGLLYILQRRLKKRLLFMIPETLNRGPEGIVSAFATEVIPRDWVGRKEKVAIIRSISNFKDHFFPA
jgi:hypothetical protein